MSRGLLFFLSLVGLSAGAAHADRRVALLMGNSALLAWLCLATSALAENRLALVIGNEGYQHIAALQKAKADAKGYADLLREKGYSVQEGYDLGFMEMLGAVARFAKKIQPGDTAVFVYSGHGWSDGTTNYVVGVDAPASEGQEVLTSVSVPIRNGLNGVLDNFTRKGAGLKVAIIDACRDNPFQPQSGERGYGLERGLRPQSIEGSFVIYSAGEGQAAMDRLSEADADPNSVFTRTLLPLLRADLPLTEAIKASQEKTHALAASADHNQMPAYYDEVLGRACLSAVCKSAIEQVPGAPTPKPVDSDDAARADYDRVKDVGSDEAWEAFLRRRTSGLYWELAKAQREKLARLENPKPSQQPEKPHDAPRPGKTVVGAAPRIATNDPGGEVFKECEDCPEMVVIPAGRAVLGSRQGEFGRDDRNEADPHEVKVSRPFAIGRYAVTAGEWKACVADGGCGSRTPGNMGFEGDRRPVIFVSWNDAQSFVDWLNKNKADRPYRLPSEAEWEFATRGCVQQECELKPFWFGAITPESAVYDRKFAYDGSPKAYLPLQTEPVDWGAPNPFGLYNMLGNVRQWTLDCWNPSPRPVRGDAAPLLTGDCSERVTRGGSWNEKPSKLRVGARGWAVADDRTQPNIGFRVVRELSP